MNLYIKSIVFFGCSLSLLIHAKNAEYPQVSFCYDWRGKSIDLALYWLGKCHKVDRELQRAFAQAFPALITAWQDQEQFLFDELFAVVPVGFTQPKRTAVICLSAPYGGYGSKHFFFLFVRSFIEQELQMPWASSISREDAFVDLVFHELLHVWIDEHINGKSALLLKYVDETSEVREHIHLMAIQKMVYLRLNRLDMIEYLDNSYRNMTCTDYARAWEIVDDIEGYDVVIADLLRYLKNKYIQRKKVREVL